MHHQRRSSQDSATSTSPTTSTSTSAALSEKSWRSASSSQESLRSIDSLTSWRSESSIPPSSGNTALTAPWRRTSSAQCQSPEPGIIYELPPFEQCPTTKYDCSKYDQGMFGHPVVILEVRGDLVDFLIISSLGGKTLEEYQQHMPDKTRNMVHRNHLPISRSPPNYLTGEQLHLAEGSFERNSYLKIQDSHTLPFAFLRPYGEQYTRKPLKFSSDTMDKVRHRMRYMTENRWSSLPARQPTNQVADPISAEQAQQQIDNIIRCATPKYSLPALRPQGKRNLGGNWRVDRQQLVG